LICLFILLFEDFVYSGFRIFLEVSTACWTNVVVQGGHKRKAQLLYSNIRRITDDLNCPPIVYHYIIEQFGFIFSAVTIPNSLFNNVSSKNHSFLVNLRSRIPMPVASYA